MVQRSYIKYHPTSGCKTAIPEMKRVYDGFEVYNYRYRRNPRRPIETDAREDDNKPMELQQLLGISLHYAPNFFNTMRHQRLDNLRHQGWEEAQVRQHEQVLQNTKLLELYIVLPGKAIDMWQLHGKFPSSSMENATDNRHGYYNVHTEVQYAINDYMNLYLYNYPEDYSQTAVQFTGQSYYFTMVHTTDKLLEQLQLDLNLVLKEKNRETNWYSRKDMDKHFQIKGERVGREGQWKTIMIGQYLEIKMTYRQTLKNIIEDKREYKQAHFHDYSVITTSIYLNEEYMKKMITEIYQQSEVKQDAAPPFQHRLLMFLVKHYPTKVQLLLQETGATMAQCHQVLHHFDQYGQKYFMKIDYDHNQCQPLHQEVPHYQGDITEEEDEDIFDEYDETRSTTRASASSSNIVHIEKQQHSLKRKITREACGTPQKKQGDVITNFYNVKIGNHAATSSTSTEQLKRTSKTAEDYTTSGATPRAPTTPTT
eukprot:880818-Amphidinium_carterae.1